MADSPGPRPLELGLSLPPKPSRSMKTTTKTISKVDLLERPDCLVVFSDSGAEYGLELDKLSQPNQR